jgi:hypothetical protein
MTTARNRRGAATDTRTGGATTRRSPMKPRRRAGDSSAEQHPTGGIAVWAQRRRHRPGARPLATSPQARHAAG